VIVLYLKIIIIVNVIYDRIQRLKKITDNIINNYINESLFNSTILILLVLFDVYFVIFKMYV
jgi:hypothetical protein